MRFDIQQDAGYLYYVCHNYRQDNFH